MSPLLTPPKPQNKWVHFKKNSCTFNVLTAFSCNNNWQVWVKSSTSLVEILSQCRQPEGSSLMLRYIILTVDSEMSKAVFRVHNDNALYPESKHSPRNHGDWKKCLVCSCQEGELREPLLNLANLRPNKIPWRPTRKEAAMFSSSFGEACPCKCLVQKQDIVGWKDRFFYFYFYSDNNETQQAVLNLISCGTLIIVLKEANDQAYNM